MSATYDILRGGDVEKTYRRAACFSNTRDDPLKSDRTCRIYIKRRWLSYGLDEIKKYIRFLNRAGFPCEYVGYIEAMNYGYGGRGDPTGSFRAYAIDVHDKDMLNVTHRLATQSLIRYLWEGSYTVIPKTILDLNLSTDWDELEIIMMAHYLPKRMLNKGGRGHACVGDKDCMLQTKEEYFGHLEKHNYMNRSHRSTHVHASFSYAGHMGLTVEQKEEVVELYKEGEYEKAKKYFL